MYYRKFVKGPVLVFFNLLLHRAEIHRFCDDGRISGSYIIGNRPCEELTGVFALQVRKQELQ